MNRLLVPAALAAALLLPISCASNPVPKPAAAQSQRVSVVIESRPDAGEVWVNGKFVGSAPMSYALEPGVHEIEVRRDRYETWKRDLTVTAQTPTRVIAALRAAS